MLNAPFPPWPVFAPDERRAVQSVLVSGRVNYWTGQEGRKFENEYANYTGRNHAVALANGTLALELALRIHDVGPGDEVVTSCWTFIASASCAAMLGAKPVLADVEADSLNISARTIEGVCTPRTRAVVCVHLAGRPCEMDSIMALAEERGLAVIEDCAQAHGAAYRDRPVGSIGHAGAFSFCQDKIMTTGGEGGMLVVDDEEMWKRAWAYKDHGKSWDAVHGTHKPGFRWLHESFGTNWRMTEMQASIGRVQLGKLDQWVGARRSNADILTQGFRKLSGLEVFEVPDHIKHAYYKYYVRIASQALKSGWDRDRVMNRIVELGVPCYAGICPEIYREKAFTKAGFGPAGPLPAAHDLGGRVLMFLVHPTLGGRDMEKTIDIVGRVMAEAVR
ncbi:MAG: DegT/DnrJ/EryC1/StrS aminotransferase family protein [Verrucomicrobiae bacterium]|nr:DegT/DnrJ/EryC1/StrS aminotransferase family protein [Verrucomicrobiae bacterium]